MSKYRLALPCCWMLALAALASDAAAQSVDYEKYQLPNGMTVILHEDHAVPMACINLWYYVGAKDEPEGRSGFAHLFEHLMFMGTERVPGGDFDTIMEAGGGWNNASTSSDRTDYYSCGPAELLPTLLWLDADRLEALGRNMTQEKLDKQRDVVRNERRQSYENAPYAKAWLAIPEMMYPEEHPYHRTVIGSHEDLEAATVDDVKNFFATYYVPSNASLVVAGSFDREQIKPLIDRLFGTLPRGSDVVHASAVPASLDEVKRRTLTDRVQFPRTYMVYHSPAEYQPGDAEMTLAADVLADGINSRLYQRLIYADKLASDVSAFQASGLLGSLFMIEATAAPGVTLDEIEPVIDQVVSEFLEAGPRAEELERLKAQREFSMVRRLQSMLAKAGAMNEYQFHFGEPDSFKRDLDRFRQATPASVQRWARQVLTPDARLILRVVPELESPEANPRDQRPELADAGAFQPPMPASFELSNGMQVHLWERRELPLVSLQMVLRGGSALDGASGAGLASLATDMLSEGAGDRDALAFSDAIDSLGASFGASAGRDDVSVYLTVLKRNLAPALDLFTDAVLRPRFDEKEWERIRRLQAENLQQALDIPGVVADWVGMRLFFGADHPYGTPASGTPETVRELELADAREFHHRVFRPSNAVLLVAGDIDAKELKGLLEKRLGDWDNPSGAAPVLEASYPTLERNPMRVVIVDRPDAVQTVISLLAPGPTYGDPRRLEHELLGTILGGSFTSRLNQNLREEHGFTYGARAGFDMEPKVGYLRGGSSVFANVTGPALREFLGEMRGIRGGDISADEAGKARLSQRRSMIDAFEGLGGTLAVAADMLRHHRPFAAVGEDLAKVMTITERDLNRLAAEAVPLENALLLLVGDEQTIRSQIADLDLPEPQVVKLEDVIR